MSRYILSPAARADLIEIGNFLKQRAGSEIATRVLRELRAGMQRVADMPGIGHLRPDVANETLRLYRVYRYLIIYRPDARPLEVVRILHAARDVRSILAE